MNQLKKYYTSDKDFDLFHFSLKQLPCPHCKLTGALILHGYLNGYDEGSHNKKVVRGRRIFCSNRRKHSKGCGLTFCVLLASMLKNFSITAKSLWCFLKHILSSSSKIEAFRYLKYPMSVSSCYRLWKRFSTSQSRIRAYLARLSTPPELPTTYCPTSQTIAHLLESAFGNCTTLTSPVAAFQAYFQIPLL